MRAGAQRRPSRGDQSRHRAGRETGNGAVDRSRAPRSRGNEDDRSGEANREHKMSKPTQSMARRAIIKGAGVGLLAGGLASALATQRADAATVDGSEIWSSEYWAKKGDIPLWMYRKRLGAPKAGEPSRPVLFFVHGSSVSSRVFDLNVPGHGEYSLMNEFARSGFDCWTMDHENYGK